MHAQEQQQRRSSSDSKMPSGAHQYWQSEQRGVERLQISTSTEEVPCIPPVGGKEYVEVDPPLISRLLPFGRHISLSAPSPPIPKCTCCSLYRCHIAHDITSWGNYTLVSVVQLILTVCAHCTLRIPSWINYPITANISRAITHYHSCLLLNFILYSFSWCSFFHRIQKATVSSHHFT